MLYQKGSFGFFSLELIAFPDPFDKSAPFSNHSMIEKKNSLFWANSLDSYYGDIQASYMISSVITGRYEKNLDKYILTFPHLPYGGLPTTNFKAFFHSTRLENIFFDVATRTGCLFLLSQALQKGMAGLLCADVNETAVFAQALKALGFLRRLANGNAPTKIGGQMFEQTTDLCSITEIFGRVKLEVKKSSANAGVVQTELLKNSRVLK